MTSHADMARDVILSGHEGSWVLGPTAFDHFGMPVNVPQQKGDEKGHRAWRLYKQNPDRSDILIARRDDNVEVQCDWNGNAWVGRAACATWFKDNVDFFDLKITTRTTTSAPDL